MKRNVSLEEAQQIILNKVLPGHKEEIGLNEGLGRVLAANILSPENVPYFDRSPLDGYSLRAEDTLNAKKGHAAVLRVIEEVPAGKIPTFQVSPGTAVKILTGALLPEGANTVIRYEDVVIKDQYIEVEQALKPYHNVVFAGEDVKINDLVAEKGTIVNGPLIGLFAAMGISTLPVYARIKAALFSTGDELVEVADSVPEGKIRNSNIHSITALCREEGVIPLNFGIAPDQKKQISERFLIALQEGDLVISTGGVSVGDYDLVKAALLDIGADILLWKIAMKPGTPTLIAMKDGKPIICLSGNPAAALVGFDLLVVPVMRKMMGYKIYMPQKVLVTMSDGFSKSGNQRRMLRAKMVFDQGHVQATITGSQNSGILRSMVDCNLLVDIPSGKGPLVVGDKLFAYVIRISR